MEMESTGNEAEVVVENAELDRVGEAGGLNAVRVELGLSGNDKSSAEVSGRLSGLTGMMELGRGGASRTKLSSVSV